MPKIISKCCELVQLCHINRSGPVFFETQCRLTSCVALTVMPASSSICLKAVYGYRQQPDGGFQPAAGGVPAHHDFFDYCAL